MGKLFSTKQKAINALIATFKKEEGYMEKKSNKGLDSKKGNAGYKNFTKYWRDINKWGFLSFGKGWAGGDSWYWCAALVFWCFVVTFGKEKAKKLLLHAPYTSCDKLGTLAKAKKRLFKSPKVGDVILFFNGSRFYHTGIVYKVTSLMVYTVEGNTNSRKGCVPNGGEVCLKSYSKMECRRKGHRFFRPDYSIVVEKPKTTTTKKTSKQSSVTKKTLTVNTTGATLNCRKSASNDGTVVGKFKKGTKVVLVEKTNAIFWKVKGKDKDGKTITGYCKKEYLK